MHPPKTYSDYAISLAVPKTLCLKVICSVTWNGDYDYFPTHHSLCLRKTVEKKFYYDGVKPPHHNSHSFQNWLIRDGHSCPLKEGKKYNTHTIRDSTAGLVLNIKRSRTRLDEQHRIGQAVKSGANISKFSY